MTIQSDIADFRIDYSVDSVQFPDTTLLRYYNDSRDYLIDRITKIKEDYFYNELSLTTTIGQREYPFPKRGDIAIDKSILDGLQKVKGISLKLKATDTNYTKLSEMTLENLPKDILTYSTNSSPFYVVSDNSMFIYPTPTDECAMIVYGIMYPKKLALTDTETIFDQYKKAIFLGMAERAYTSQNKFNEATLQGTKFRDECNRVAISLSGRTQNPKTYNLPSLSNFC